MHEAIKLGFIIFCGGDGTARDISSETSDRVPILGVPSGVKMYSGVFGITAEQTAHILHRFVNGELDTATVTEFTELINANTAAVVVQQPDFFGVLQDLQKFANAVHQVNALFIVVVDPISLGLFKPPADEYAPFDAILVTAGAPEVTDTLKKQLAIGGRLVIPVGSSLHTQKLLRVRRISEDEYHAIL